MSQEHSKHLVESVLIAIDNNDIGCEAAFSASLALVGIIAIKLHLPKEKIRFYFERMLINYEPYINDVIDQENI